MILYAFSFWIFIFVISSDAKNHRTWSSVVIFLGDKETKAKRKRNLVSGLSLKSQLRDPVVGPSWRTKLRDHQVEGPPSWGTQLRDQVEGPSWGTKLRDQVEGPSWDVLTPKVKVQLSWYGPLAWLRLRFRLSQSNIIAGLSKVVVLVVLCGQICKIVEICPYRQI